MFAATRKDWWTAAVFATAFAYITSLDPTLMVRSARAGQPTFSGCGGAAGNVGPCVGANAWDSGVGNGCALCGNNGNISFSFAGGSCIGTDPLPSGVFNCTQCSMPATSTDVYLSTPKSTWDTIMCFAAVTGISIGFWGAVCLIGCCGLSIGVGCVTGACFALCGLILVGGLTGIALSCAWGRCTYTCAYSVTFTSGSATACS